MATINSWIRRNPLITALICILAVVLLTGFISLQTNGFNNPEDLFTRETNPDNLLVPGEDGNYLLTEEWKTNEGLVVTPKSNGAIKISGTNENYLDGAHNEKDIAVITLEKGTYTLSSGYSGTSTSTAWLEARYGENVVLADLGDAKGEFTLTETTEVTITLCVFPRAGWNVTIYPVLVAGDEPGSFYA